MNRLPPGQVMFCMRLILAVALLLLVVAPARAQMVIKKDIPGATYNFRHRVSWVATDVFALRLLFAYEHLNESGTIGIRIPVGVGISTNIFDWESPGLTAITGAELNLYPTTARGPVKYYYGPMLRVGYAHADIHRGDESAFFVLGFNNGVAFSLKDNFFLSLYAGPAIKYAYYFNPDSSPEPYGRLYPHFIFGLSVGLNID